MESNHDLAALSLEKRDVLDVLFGQRADELEDRFLLVSLFDEAVEDRGKCGAVALELLLLDEAVIPHPAGTGVQEKDALEVLSKARGRCRNEDLGFWMAGCKASGGCQLSEDCLLVDAGDPRPLSAFGAAFAELGIGHLDFMVVGTGLLDAFIERLARRGILGGQPLLDDLQAVLPHPQGDRKIESRPETPFRPGLLAIELAAQREF